MPTVRHPNVPAIRFDVPDVTEWVAAGWVDPDAESQPEPDPATDPAPDSGRAADPEGK